MSLERNDWPRSDCTEQIFELHSLLEPQLASTIKRARTGAGRTGLNEVLDESIARELAAEGMQIERIGSIAFSKAHFPHADRRFDPFLQDAYL